jgi:ketosteroid isomerase-like protein
MPDFEKRLHELERKVWELADRDAIRELTAEYCRCVVREDRDGLVGLFTSDATLETHFPPGSDQADVVSAGMAELQKAYEGVVGLQLRPFIHNHVIELDGDRARGFCSVEIRLVQRGVAYTGAGHYEDVYRRVDGRWRFQRRELFVYHWVPLAKGWA